ncbi:MAG TPA: VOC family protein [Longimicrobiales bacterium]
MTTSIDRAAVQFGGVVPHMAVADVVHTAEYYRDVLGFEIDGYWDGEEVHQDPTRSAVFGIVRRGQASIHFNRGQQANPPSRLSEGAYDLYFNVVNVNVLADELRGRGAQIIDGPEERVYGQRELVVRDCNGLILAFGEPLRTSAS